MSLTLPPAWQAVLSPALWTTPAWHQLSDRLQALAQSGWPAFPPPDQVFAALAAVPPSHVQVVILGQDPYHGPGQAHGYAFSVPSGQPLPPSLRNILREWQDDLGLAPPGHGCLTAWASQGVLLLNTVLTVAPGQAGSHAHWGWQLLTRAILQAVCRQRSPTMFLLWGRQAAAMMPADLPDWHGCLRSAHPSPLAANRGGWFGQKPFSRTNAWRAAQGLAPIDWSLPSRQANGDLFDVN